MKMPGILVWNTRVLEKETLCKILNVCSKNKGMREGKRKMG
jgi:hypothetical protein